MCFLPQLEVREEHYRTNRKAKLRGPSEIGFDKKLHNCSKPLKWFFFIFCLQSPRLKSWANAIKKQFTKPLQRF